MKQTKREYNQEYYWSNRKKILQQKREYQKANREVINKKNRKYYHTNDKYRIALNERVKLKKRAWRLEKDYKITNEQFDNMLISQGNRCAICKSDSWGRKGIPHIDHDHVTNKVRGLLCAACNLGLGLFKDSFINLQEATNYLKKHA